MVKIPNSQHSGNFITDALDKENNTIHSKACGQSVKPVLLDCQFNLRN